MLGQVYYLVGHHKELVFDLRVHCLVLFADAYHSSNFVKFLGIFLQFRNFLAYLGVFYVKRYRMPSGNGHKQQWSHLNNSGFCISQKYIQKQFELLNV